MSDSSGGVAPAARTHEFLPSANVYWQEKSWGSDFKESFAAGAEFSMAVMGAGFNLVRAGAQGQVKANFG